MIQQTESRFRINDWKNYSDFFFFFQSPKHTIVNQLHMYNGVGYKQDKKIKIRVTDSIQILQFLYLFNTS